MKTDQKYKIINEMESRLLILTNLSVSEFLFQKSVTDKLFNIKGLKGI